MSEMSRANDSASSSSSACSTEAAVLTCAAVCAKTAESKTRVSSSSSTTRILTPVKSGISPNRRFRRRAVVAALPGFGDDAETRQFDNKSRAFAFAFAFDFRRAAVQLG
jgi:hypothetical protein